MKSLRVLACLLPLLAVAPAAWAQQDDSRLGSEQDYRGMLVLRFPFAGKREVPPAPEFGVNLENRSTDRDGYTHDDYDREFGMRLPRDDLGRVRTFPMELPEFKLNDRTEPDGEG